MKVDCVHAEELVDVTFVTVGDLLIEVGVYSSSVYGAVFRALTPPGSCWTTLQEAVDEVAPPPDMFPMMIAAEAVPNGVPESIQINFAINGVTKTTPYAESLVSGAYSFVFPSPILFNGVSYTILGANQFTINHPENGETYFKASYFAELPPPQIGVSFDSTEGGKIDWGEGAKDFGSVMVDPGTVLTIQPYPNAGYVHHHWVVNGVSVVASMRSFKIDEETTITAVFEEEGGPPNSNGDCEYSRSKTVFNNWVIKSSAYETGFKTVVAKTTSGSPMPVSGKLRYVLNYEDGNFPTAAIRIRFNEQLVLRTSLNKGVPLSGEVDISGFILENNSVKIGLTSTYGFWQKASFTVHVDFCYASEPTEDPKTTPPEEPKDWMKWLPWIAVGGLALMLLMRGGKQVIVMRD